MFEHMPILRGMYTSDWSDYRRRRFQFFTTYLVVCPSLAVLAVLAVAAGLLAANDITAMIITAPGGVAFLVTTLRLSAFACPRCGKPFFYRGFGGNPLTSNCLHCNLPKWATCNLAERESWLQEPAWQCLNCDARIDPSADCCNECGWTYATKNGEPSDAPPPRNEAF